MNILGFSFEWANGPSLLYIKQNGHACLGLEVKQVLYAKILRVHVPKKIIRKSSFNTGKIKGLLLEIYAN